jgi:hypothetical protein
MLDLEQGYVTPSEIKNLLGVVVHDLDLELKKSVSDIRADVILEMVENAKYRLLSLCSKNIERMEKK